MAGNVFGIASGKVRPLTLVYLKRGSKVLLIKRLDTKKLFPGKWLGIGGRMEPGESLIDSAKREFMEETGLQIKDPVLRGTYTWLDRTDPNHSSGTLYIFVANESEGELASECSEGRLEWHNIDELDEMSDLAEHQRLFLRKMLQDDGYFFCGIGEYDNTRLVRQINSDGYFDGRGK